MPYTRDGTPYSRSGTSRAAAESQRGKHGIDRERVLSMITGAQAQGMTCWEVERAGGFSHQTASARIAQLHQRDHIVDSGRRRRTGTGRQAIVWIAVQPKGEMGEKHG